jgi:uncharacterized protein with GYD domain
MEVGPRERSGRATYLLRYRFKPEAWTTMTRHPHDLREAAAEVVEQVSNFRLRDFWYAFGQHECYLVLEGDGAVDVAVIATSLAAGASLRLVETIQLFSSSDVIETLTRTQRLLRRRERAS